MHAILTQFSSNQVTITQSQSPRYTKNALSGLTLNSSPYKFPSSSICEYHRCLSTAKYEMYDFESGVVYHYITYECEYGNTGPMNVYNPSNTMSSISSWGNYFPPCVLTVDYPELIKTRKKSYNKEAFKGPDSNIYNKYIRCI